MIEEQQWSAPDGVHLLERVSIEGVQAAETGEFLRAHVTLPEFARTNVRTEGRRVYIDLTWPMTAPEASCPTRHRTGAAQPAPAPTPRPSPVAREEPQASAKYAEQLRGVLDRIVEVKPFLMSAAKSASPDVLGALDETLSCARVVAERHARPGRAADQHQMLLSVDSHGAESGGPVVLRATGRAGA